MIRTIALAGLLALAAGGALAGPLTVSDLDLPLDAPRAEALDPDGRAPLDDPLTCLARTIYWEAKGQSREGKVAVAHVVRNRVESDAHPDTYCAVVTEGGEGAPCQFSWWCDGAPDAVENAEQFRIAREVARGVLNGASDDPTGGATFFHATYVTPAWTREAERVGRIGDHVFYVMK